jgi:hypothetical protein
MLRVVLALGLSVVLLGGIAGCGGAGEASTTDAKDRVGLDTHKGGASDGTGNSTAPGGTIEE